MPSQVPALPRTLHHERSLLLSTPGIPADSVDRTHELTGSVVNGLLMCEVLGKGAYGVVLRAKEIATSREYAVKVMSRSQLKAKKEWVREGGRMRVTTALDKVKRELAIMAKVSHPHVVKCHFTIDDESSDRIFLVLELLRGGTAMTYVDLPPPPPQLPAVRLRQPPLSSFEAIPEGNHSRTSDATTLVSSAGAAAVAAASDPPSDETYGHAEEREEEETVRALAGRYMCLGPPPPVSAGFASRSRLNSKGSLGSSRSNLVAPTPSPAPSSAAGDNSVRPRSPLLNSLPAGSSGSLARPASGSFSAGDDVLAAQSAEAQSSLAVASQSNSPPDAANAGAKAQTSATVPKPRAPVGSTRSLLLSSSSSAVPSFAAGSVVRSPGIGVGLTMTMGQARRVVRDVLQGLTYLFSNAIVHRDCKPENILLTGPEGLSRHSNSDNSDSSYSATEFALVSARESTATSLTSAPVAAAVGSTSSSPPVDPVDVELNADPSVRAIGHALLADLGVAHIYDPGAKDDLLKKTEGTPAFHAPEATVGSVQGFSGQASDVWAIGVCAFSFLTGTLPFPVYHGTTQEELYHSIRDDPLPVELLLGSAAVQAWLQPLQGQAHLTLPQLRSRLALIACMVDFIDCLLAKDPSKRATAASALQHPWLTYVEGSRSCASQQTGTAAAIASSEETPLPPSAVDDSVETAKDAAAGGAPHMDTTADAVVTDAQIVTVLSAIVDAGVIVQLPPADEQASLPQWLQMYYTSRSSASATAYTDAAGSASSRSRASDVPTAGAASSYAAGGAAPASAALSSGDLLARLTLTSQRHLVMSSASSSGAVGTPLLVLAPDVDDDGTEEEGGGGDTVTRKDGGSSEVVMPHEAMTAAELVASVVGTTDLASPRPFALSFAPGAAMEVTEEEVKALVQQLMPIADVVMLKVMVFRLILKLRRRLHARKAAALAAAASEAANADAPAAPAVISSNTSSVASDASSMLLEQTAVSTAVDGSPPATARTSATAITAPQPQASVAAVYAWPMASVLPRKQSILPLPQAQTKASSQLSVDRAALEGAAQLTAGDASSRSPSSDGGLLSSSSVPAAMAETRDSSAASSQPHAAAAANPAFCTPAKSLSAPPDIASPTSVAAAAGYPSNVTSAAPPASPWAAVPPASAKRLQRLLGAEPIAAPSLPLSSVGALVAGIQQHLSFSDVGEDSAPPAPPQRRLQAERISTTNAAHSVSASYSPARRILLPYVTPLDSGLIATGLSLTSSVSSGSGGNGLLAASLLPLGPVGTGDGAMNPWSGAYYSSTAASTGGGSSQAVASDDGSDPAGRPHGLTISSLLQRSRGAAGERAR